MAMTPRLDLRTGVRLGQKLGLSQTVLSALAVLRLPAAELAEHLAAEAAANPFLLPGLPPPPARAMPIAEGLDFLGAAEPAWQERLMQQIRLMPLPQPVTALALHLVGELDERGWLDIPLAELAQRDRLDPALLEQALTALQRCEPAGVGARDLNECLLLQLIDLGLTPDAARATLAELPRFARRDWPGLMRALGLDRDGVTVRAALLRRLTARPADRFEAEAPAAVLRPDLVLVRNPSGADTVALATDHLPRPRLDAALLRRATAESFGADMAARARALVRAVESRGTTLRRVGDWLVVRQQAALRDGPGALRPATRSEVAAALALHPSTIGRAVAGKALLADGRLWPLSALFSGPAGAADSDAADAPAARAVALRLAALIAAEPAARPLSDAALAERLGTEGVDIARRTVAKYRNGLRIPPAHRRRDKG